MRIIETYSHFNGLEFLLIRKPKVWKEIQDIVKDVNADFCRTKETGKIVMKGEHLYSPFAINYHLRKSLESKKWNVNRVGYWSRGSEKSIRKTSKIDSEEQKIAIEVVNETPLQSYIQTDFVKDRVAIEVQFGKYSFIAYDLFVKHLAFYIGDKIDVGVEILPMKSLQSEMSSGVAYYEGELYNVIRQGRGVPAVPLVIVGIEA